MSPLFFQTSAYLGFNLIASLKHSKACSYFFYFLKVIPLLYHFNTYFGLSFFTFLKQPNACSNLFYLIKISVLFSKKTTK